MPVIRVLDNTRKSMERLGFLKRLAKRVSSSHTSHLDNLGTDLIDTVSAKVRVQLDIEKAEYVRRRLDDPIYRLLRSRTMKWLSAPQEERGTLIEPMELQDLYLADPVLPSQTGKLVKDDWNRYPVLGLRLGLIRAGTYSATTRTISLLHLCAEELPAFLEYKPEINPLKISPQQAIFFLYILLENDGEVIAPLFSQLSAIPDLSFTDHRAGNLLPEIYQNIISRHQQRMLPIEARERLTSLEKLARSVTKVREGKPTGSSIRDQISRVRVEPYVDIGLLVKTDHFNHEYNFSPCGLVWVEALKGILTSEDIGKLLSKQFFSLSAKAFGLDANVLKDTVSVIPHMFRAWQVINSPGGYAPIEEIALLGGIQALFEHNLIIDPVTAREAIMDYQKQNPYKVRFTVNRLGVLAHVRFIEDSLPKT